METFNGRQRVKESPKTWNHLNNHPKSSKRLKNGGHKIPLRQRRPSHRQRREANGERTCLRSCSTIFPHEKEQLVEGGRPPTIHSCAGRSAQLFGAAAPPPLGPPSSTSSPPLVHLGPLRFKVQVSSCSSWLLGYRVNGFTNEGFAELIQSKSTGLVNWIGSSSSKSRSLRLGGIRWADGWLLIEDLTSELLIGLIGVMSLMDLLEGSLQGGGAFLERLPLFLLVWSGGYIFNGS